MKINRIRGSLVGMMVGLFFVGQAIAREDTSWLVRQKNASPNGQWVLRQDGAVNLLPRPSREVPKRTEDVAKKDDRKDLEGNRGRPADNESEKKAEKKFLSTRYLFVDFYTVTAWDYEHGSKTNIDRFGKSVPVDPMTLLSNRFATHGYTPEEAEFLYSLKREQLVEAAYKGSLAMPSVETKLTPSRQLDLKRVLDYATAQNFYVKPGDTLRFNVQLTNPSDQPLKLAVESTITYMQAQWSIQGRGNWDSLRREYVSNQALPGDSKQVWKNVVLQPGESLVLNGSYFMPQGTRYPSNYTISVNLKDQTSGKTFSKAGAGYFGNTGIWPDNAFPVIRK